MNSSQKNQNKTQSTSVDNNSYKEPNIRKAKFIISQKRIYTLEFDQNIEMQELKVMIAKAAHLRKNSFNLFCQGVDYTHYTEETFDSFFPEQILVEFTLELKDKINLDKTELLLQINAPCPEHDYKFLLYYCFDCGKSICSECFTNGAHKGHKIKDKCFYLLQSKYLVEKMLQEWNTKPYEDFQISVNLKEYKNRLNNVIFKQLFEMLNEAQKKCNELINKYNLINEKSLSNIKDSVKEIKVSCIKALDEYKDLIDIKDIINNQEIFIDFDRTYKEIGNKQKEKYKENMEKFKELNQEVSISVENLINDIVQKINEVLAKAIDDKQYDEIEQKMNLKLINPTNKDDILEELNDKKIRMKRNKYYGRNTINGFNKYNRKKQIEEGNEKIEYENNDEIKEQGRNTIPLNNINSINYFDNTNSNNDNKNNDDIIENNQQASNGKNNNIIFSNNAINNINNNYSVDSTFQKPSIIKTNNENKDNISQLLNNMKTNYSNNEISDFNTISNNNNKIKIENSNSSAIKEENSSQNNQTFGNKNNIFNYQNNNTNNNIMNQIGNDENNNIVNNNGKPFHNIFDSILNDNKNNTNNSNNNLLNTVSNNKTNLFLDNNISPICDNRTNNGIFSNNTSFDLNNMNSSKPKTEISNLNINNNMNSDAQNPFTFEYDNNNKIDSNINNNSKNILLSSPFSQMIPNNNNNNFIENKNEINILNTPSQNENIMNVMDNKYLAGLANNCKTILEEANESESDIKIQKVKNINIEYYLKKSYILCPIPTTNKVKIITDDESDENILTISFPNDFNISSFLYNCAYCNHNQKLYISGGIINPDSSEIISNKFYMIDLSKFKIDNNSNNINCINSCIFELSPMIYNRYNHALIGYNNEIYAVGGENMNSVEKYDIENKEWIEINSMIQKRSNTMLTIVNGYLYAFFGKGENGNYPESIERLNIQDNYSIWEMILYSNPSNICTKVYGCALFQIGDLIYFLGGKANEKKIDEIFYFNLIDRRIDYTDSKLAWKESFRENNLFDVGEKIIQISDERFFGIYLTICVQ